MKIAFIEIQNFRKLKSCRIEFSDTQTVFVGANNSGKTSAMDSLIRFLKRDRKKDITTTDFTLSNWKDINAIGESWIKTKDPKSASLSLEVWMPFLPSIDIWIEVEDDEIHYISHLIPSLNWEGGLLGVRLSFEVDNLEQLYKDFCPSFIAAQKIIENGKQVTEKTTLSLWPKSMRDFLDKSLHTYFDIKAYILDPSKLQDPTSGLANPQVLSAENTCLDIDPFRGLFKIDTINAQRGFSDSTTEDAPSSGKNARGLSTQFQDYFEKHLNPSELPTDDDLDALKAIHAARTSFDHTLRTSFDSALNELEGLNYPGFSDPEIKLTSKITPINSLNHDTAVQFNILKNSDGNTDLYLPEKYNGLGYQNLISMVFSLIRFRDEWMRKGKAGLRQKSEDKVIEPLHLVLIEEPEAHLHAQVQQVFIKKAYAVLRNHIDLKDKTHFKTQMILSTHSSHIAHEIDFCSLRYFRRILSQSMTEVPCVTVVNLSTTFGSEKTTSKFATRYLKTTHCDLFFADAAILVEGPAERMLIPSFIRHKFQSLDACYITLLEIGGSHAHRLKQLIDDLGLTTLIVTDIDSIGETDQTKVIPEKNKKYRTRNETLVNWLPRQKDLDNLVKPGVNKLSDNLLVRVAYQTPFEISFSKEDKETQEVFPYTFEDALAFSNIDIFRNMKGHKGLINKMYQALSLSTPKEACVEMFKALKKGRKAEMALELLYLQDPSKLNCPEYIQDGLEWLQKKLEVQKEGISTGDQA